jgi:hypothetical protein
MLYPLYHSPMPSVNPLQRLASNPVESKQPVPSPSTGSVIAKETSDKKKGPVRPHGAFSQTFDVSSYTDAVTCYSDSSLRRISHQAMLARPVVAAAPAAATGAARCTGLGAALATTSQSSSHSPLHSTPCPG